MIKNKKCSTKIHIFIEYIKEKKSRSNTKDGGLEKQVINSKSKLTFLLDFMNRFSCIHETMPIKYLFMKLFIMFIKELIKMIL